MPATPTKNNGDKKRPPTSPYKKVAHKNKEHIGYTNMYNLTPNKLYQILGFTPSTHEKYGAGYRALIKSSTKSRYNVQVPGKYLNQLTLPDDINEMIKDIDNGKNPYLIYRETMPDKSYRIDIIPPDEDILHKFKQNKDVPELDNSVSSMESTQTS